MTQDEQRLIDGLSERGYRITSPRRAIVRALLELGGSPSPGQVHAQARQFCPTVGLVTVYRTLDILASSGLVRRIHSESGCHGYAVSRNGHHHHLVCRRCGAAVVFQGCDLDTFFGRVGSQTGYKIEGHLLELVGVCSDCQQAEAEFGSQVD